MEEVVYLEGEELEQARQELRHELAEEFGTVDHPREEQLFELAWSYGAALDTDEPVDGAVRFCYADFVSLLS